MKFNRNLVTGLIGLALIAAPITAAAKDNDRGGNNSHQEQAQARSNESHADARQQERHQDQANNEAARDQHQARVENRQDNHEARVENRQDNRNEARDNRQDFRNQVRDERRDNRNEARDQRNDYRGYTGAPYVNEHRDAREDRRDWNHQGRDWNHDGGERWIYGDRGRDYDRAYDPDYDNEYASGWVMPRGYYGGSCGWARHLRNVYNHDRYTGHPAAAQSLLWQMRRAERNCGGVHYGYNRYRYDRY